MRVLTTRCRGEWTKHMSRLNGISVDDYLILLERVEFETKSIDFFQVNLAS